MTPLSHNYTLSADPVNQGWYYSLQCCMFCLLKILKALDRAHYMSDQWTPLWPMTTLFLLLPSLFLCSCLSKYLLIKTQTKPPKQGKDQHRISGDCKHAKVSYTVRKWNLQLSKGDDPWYQYLIADNLQLSTCCSPALKRYGFWDGIILS